MDRDGQARFTKEIQTNEIGHAACDLPGSALEPGIRLEIAASKQSRGAGAGASNHMADRVSARADNGVAAAVEQQRQLLVDATPAAVAARVGQAPVAVDERVAQPPAGIARQVAVLGVEAQVLVDGAAQVLGVVVVVVQVKLDLTEAPAGQAAERVQVIGAVLLAGEEERVARLASIGVAERRGQRGVSRKQGEQSEEGRAGRHGVSPSARGSAAGR